MSNRRTVFINPIINRFLEGEDGIFINKLLTKISNTLIFYNMESTLKIFQFYDKDTTGYITIYIFHLILKDLYIEYTEPEVSLLQKVIMKDDPKHIEMCDSINYITLIDLINNKRGEYSQIPSKIFIWCRDQIMFGKNLQEILSESLSKTTNNSNYCKNLTLQEFEILFDRIGYRIDSLTLKQIQNKYSDGNYNKIDYKRFIKELLSSLSNEITHYTIRNKHRTLILESVNGFILRGSFMKYDRYNTGKVTIDEYLSVFSDLYIPLSKYEIMSPLTVIMTNDSVVDYRKYFRYIAYSEYELYIYIYFLFFYI